MAGNSFHYEFLSKGNVKSELYFSNASALRSGIGAPVGFWVGAQ